ncbi:hypothetical protein HZS_2419 [Henneguya salminicola]|nr:hypothetical protein HZS_2419 [Henneguya salminicola]
MLPRFKLIQILHAEDENSQKFFSYQERARLKRLPRTLQNFKICGTIHITRGSKNFVERYNRMIGNFYSLNKGRI